MMIQHHDRRKRSTPKILIVGVVLVFLLSLALFTSSLAHLSAGAQTVAVPLWKIGDMTSVALEPVSSYFSSKETLALKNKELQQEVDSMVAKLADRDYLREENGRLKGLLDRNISKKRTLGVVLSKPGHAPYDMLIIDIGKDQGINVGEKVLFENVLIGETVEVFDRSSKVILYSSPEHSFIVQVGEKGLEAEAVGRGAGNYEIIMPKNSGIMMGDTVFVPHLEPRVLGTVEEIKSGPKDISELILFKSPVNFNNLRFVEVSPE